VRTILTQICWAGRIQSSSMLKQEIHIVTTGLWKVNRHASPSSFGHFPQTTLIKGDIFSFRIVWHQIKYKFNKNIKYEFQVKFQELLHLFFNIKVICTQIIYLLKLQHMTADMTSYCKRYSYPCNRTWRPIGLWDVEAPKFCLDIRLTDGSKVVSPTRRLPFTPQENCWYSFLLEAESTPGP
jgi:hypothetical protein